MNYDGNRAYEALTNAAINLSMGNTGNAIELAKRAITLMENSLPPAVPTYDALNENKHSDQRER